MLIVEIAFCFGVFSVNPSFGRISMRALVDSLSLERSQDQTEQSELGSSKQKKRKHMSTFELSQIIEENGITMRTELLEFAEELCGEEKTDIAGFVVNRGSLVVAEVPQTA